MKYEELTNDYLVTKAFKSYFLFSLMSVVVATIGILIDGIIIGNFFGNKELAAFGIASPFIIVLLALSTVFGKGGIVACSNYVGRGEINQVNINFTVTLLVATIISIIITLLTSFYINPLTLFLGAEGILIQLTTDYLFGLVLGTLPLILSQVLLSYIRLDGSPFLGMISAIIITIINIILDILFATVLDLGLFGIGLATSISYVIGTLILCYHFLLKRNTLKFTKIKGGFEEIRNVIKLGLPSALNRLYITFRSVLTNNLAIWIGGTVAIGALSIQTNIYQFLVSVSMGVGMTTILLGGVFFGEQDKKALKYLLKVSLKYGLGITIPIAVILIIFTPYIVGVFGNNPEILSTTIRSLRLFAPSLPLALICIVLLNYYNATKNLLISNYIAFAHSFLFISLFALIATPLIGEDGIWLCFTVGEILTLIGLIFLIKYKYGKFPKSTEDFLLLDDNFEKDINSNLSISINGNMDEVMKLSNYVQEFGKNYPGKENIINKLALCVEEMGGNIVEHGFKSCHNHHYIDVRIILTSKNVIFRIRDDGIPFNPIEYANKCEKTENTMGIKIIQKIATNMEYRHTIGLNNLTITFSGD
ncbi:MATE family efflux transporter [Methanobrevibacter sp. DSM 116169]|uniref:MATE family efflux transporter n=1 Tax=Methanobrevibacter sp. DSM 116169 TaxID=3242727 RepID=UPI0038FC631B